MVPLLLSRLCHVANAGLDLLFPPLCVGCGRLGERFCPLCAQAVEAVPLPQCAHCGLVLPVQAIRCVNCAGRADDPLTLTRAAALHTTPLREAIHAFKYEGQPELAPLLARYLTAVYAEPPWSELLQPVTAVVPVPLHPQRLAERGYNQAALLAATFGEAVGLPVQPGWLERTRETRHQVGLGPSERQANVDGAFAATRALTGYRLLLIDDVYTTGATLRACATAALVAGASAVFGLTLAQPVRRSVFSLSEESSDAEAPADLPWWEGQL